MQMKKNTLIILLVLLPSCTWWGQTKSEPTSGLIVVNVLDNEYYKDRRIDGSINVLVDELDAKSDTCVKASKVVFSCTNYYCTSSGWAAEQLAKKGFKNVYAYEGGMAEWHQKGLPSQGPGKKGYLAKEVKPFDDEEKPKGYTIIKADELHSKMQTAKNKEAA